MAKKSQLVSCKSLLVKLLQLHQLDLKSVVSTSGSEFNALVQLLKSWYDH